MHCELLVTWPSFYCIKYLNNVYVSSQRHSFLHLNSEKIPKPCHQCNAKDKATISFASFFSFFQKYNSNLPLSAPSNSMYQNDIQLSCFLIPKLISKIKLTLLFFILNHILWPWFLYWLTKYKHLKRQHMKGPCFRCQYPNKEAKIF